MPAPAPLVLIASDMASIRQAAIGVLKQLHIGGFVEATSLQAAVQALKAQVPHLVIADWDMAGNQGHHLLQVIKSSQPLHNVPVLVLAEGRAENVKAAVEAGAASIVLKPFSPAALQAKIATFLPPPAIKSGLGHFERI